MSIRLNRSVSVGLVVVAFPMCHVALAQAVDKNELHVVSWSQASANDNFGWSIAISDGRLLVGVQDASTPQGANTGLAVTYSVDTGGNETEYLPTTVGPQTFLGQSCDMDGDVFVVGAIEESTTGTDSGAVYIIDSANATVVTILNPAAVVPESDRFGYSVAIDNGLVAVGAPFADVDGSPNNPKGLVYLFQTNGTLIGTVVPDSHGIGNDFGYSVDLDGVEFDQSGQLIAGDLVVGDPADGQGSLNFAGSAYLFDVVTGDQIQLLRPDTRINPERFGEDVAIDGSMIVVGGPGINDGAGYVFDRDTGSLLHKLVPTDPDYRVDDAGASVAIEGDLVVIGAPGSSNGPAGQFTNDAGAAYVFRASTGEQLLNLKNSDSRYDDRLGHAVAIEGGYIAVSAVFEDIGAVDTGAVLVFSSAVPCSRADLAEPYAELNFFDVSAFLALYDNLDPSADFNSDGEINFFDISVFLSEYGMGCP